MTEETYCLLDGDGDWWVGATATEMRMVGDAISTLGPLASASAIAGAHGIDGGEDDEVAAHFRALTAPDSAADGYAWPTLAQGSTIAHDAHEVVYGRGDNYGHPRDNHTRIAQLWTALLSQHLADGAYITPEDVARCMIGVKLARDVNHEKRDNRVDIAGYAITLDRMATGQ